MSSSSTPSSVTSFLTSRPASLLLLLTGSSLLLFLSPRWTHYFKPISKSSDSDTSSRNDRAPPPTSSPNSSQRKPIAIFWDVDNCAPPSGSSGREIALAIRKAVQLATTPSHSKGHQPNGSENPIVVFKAYLELSAENSAPLSRDQVILRSELQGCGVTLIDSEY